MSPPDHLARSLSPEDLPDPQRSLELLVEAQAGSREALEELISRYQHRLRRIVRIQLARSMLRGELESMDVVQDTFRAALPKIAELRPSSGAALLRWLALIATNQLRDAHDYQRAAKRDVSRKSPLGPLESSGSAGLTRETSPEDAALLGEVRDLLDDEVGRLPEDQRRVVLLRDYCGEAWERIAAELEREEGAARQLHQRAWIRLRQVLRPKLEGRT